MYVKFQIGKQVNIQEITNVLAQNVSDWTPALTQSAEDILAFVEGEVFDTAGEAIDQPWQELSPEYAIKKDKYYPDGQILVATGEMKESFDKIVEPTQLVIGNTAEYFVYHQSSAPRHKMPRRVMLAITQGVIDMVMANFQAQLDNELAGGTGR